VLSVSLVCCAAAGHWSGRVLPDGRPHPPNNFNNVAYIDASHLEAYSSAPSADLAIVDLERTLMRYGYLPLLAPDLTQERLERAGLLISIGPAREFSPAERGAVNEFLGAGGTFICMVGAEQARASAAMLDALDLHVPASPVPPGDNAHEPYPLGAGYGLLEGGGWHACFYAVWPAETVDSDARRLAYWDDGAKEWPLVLSKSVNGGAVVVIGDTYFATNKNIAIDQNASNRFWRWLLSRVVPGQKEWNPPPGTQDMNPAEGTDEGNSEETMKEPE
jgi:hypothetical protein